MEAELRGLMTRPIEPAKVIEVVERHHSDASSSNDELNRIHFLKNIPEPAKPHLILWTEDQAKG